jgi:hypothetical protein
MAALRSGADHRCPGQVAQDATVPLATVAFDHDRPG